MNKTYKNIGSVVMLLGVIAFVAFMESPRAYAGTFGYSAIASNSLSGSMLYYATAPATGTITSISCYTGGGGNINAGYSTGTAGGGVVANVAHGTSQANIAGAGWATIPVSGSITSGTGYWLECQESSAQDYYDHTSAGGDNMIYNFDSPYDNWTGTGCGAACLNGYAASVYATYTTGGGGGGVITPDANNFILFN